MKRVSEAIMKSANKRYGTPIDKDLMKELQAEMELLKAINKNVE